MTLKSSPINTLKPDGVVGGGTGLTTVEVTYVVQHHLRQAG